MALADYEDLLATVKDYEADEGASVVTHIDDFVVLAEARIFLGGGMFGEASHSKPLRVKSMEKSVVIPIGTGEACGTTAGTANAQTATVVSPFARGSMVTFTAGFTNTAALTFNGQMVKKGAYRDELEASDILVGAKYTLYCDGTVWVLMVADGSAPLPKRFLGHRSAYLNDFPKPLEYRVNSNSNWDIDTDTYMHPGFYSVSGDCLRLGPVPSGQQKVLLNYYERPAPLAERLNDIYRDCPAIYLFATLFELAAYLPSPDRAAGYFAQFKSAISGYALSQARTETNYSTMRLNLRNNL
jgi:hypothetical protein